MTEKRKKRQDMAGRRAGRRQDMRRESRRIQKRRPAIGGAKISRGTGRFPARHEYEKALCVQVNHLKQRQVILSDNVIVL